jgi:site-specific DNA-methyltransferase (adenine-specific)
MKPYYEHAGITIYHGDCREILPQLSGLAGIVTDPPYGIDLDVQRYAGARGSLDGSSYRRNGVSKKYEQFHGEKDQLSFAFLWGITPVQIIWGANNFPQQLPFDPRTDGWICWDKRETEDADRMLGSPFELAVVLGRRLYKIFRLQHGGAINADEANTSRWHPTQKPVRLMQRILREFFADKQICDPFLGSGSTLIAAKKLGYPAIGIEIEEKYCEIAAKRLSQEVLDFQPAGEPQP